MKRATLLALLCLGCASLNLRPDDDGIATAGKVTSRLVLFVPTLGISELVLASKRSQQACEIERAAEMKRILGEVAVRETEVRDATTQGDLEIALRKYDAAREYYVAYAGQRACR